MTLQIDLMYVKLLGSSLRNFKQRDVDLFQCSCPFCGDSQKNKTKARGFFFKAENSLLYKCHNCGISLNCGAVLKQLNDSLFQQYFFDKYKTNGFRNTKQPAIEKKAPVFIESVKIDLPSIKELPPGHYVKDYVISRKIPTDKHHLLYFAEHFRDWALEKIDKKYDKLPNDHRLVLPFYSQQGVLVGAQGRGFDGDKKLRYITAKRSDVQSMVFGLDRWDKFQKTYVTEGPIDSLFLPNALAVATSDLVSVLDRIPELEKDNTVFVFDNEPCSKEIVGIIEGAINTGLQVCLWPHTIKQKDINDMILNGLTIEDVVDIIEKNTVAGTSGKVQFCFWRKC